MVAQAIKQHEQAAPVASHMRAQQQLLHTTITQHLHFAIVDVNVNLNLNVDANVNANVNANVIANV